MSSRSRFGSPYGFGEYFRGGMGAEYIRELLREKPEYDREARRAVDAERLAGMNLARRTCRDRPRARAHRPRGLVKNGKGQKQARAVKRLKVLVGVPALQQQARR